MLKSSCKWVEKGKEATTDQNRKEEGLAAWKKGKTSGKKQSGEDEIDPAKPSTSHEGADVSDSENSGQPLSSSAKKIKKLKTD